jgi:hypothetical protein
MRPESAAPSSTDSPWGWPALTAAVLLLLAQLSLYGLMANRGLDVSDESYYLVSYLHWREFHANVSFFGAFFEWPFRWLGHSVAAMRVLTMLMLMGSSCLLARSALAHAGRLRGLPADNAWPLVLCTMAGAMLYFSFLTTLRAPSYNLLALCSMMLSTALFLRVLDARAQVGQDARALVPRVLGYGFLLGVCGLAKGSTGALLVLLHVAYFGAENNDWRWRPLLRICAVAMLGLVLCFLLLQATDGAWLSRLREGLAVNQTSGGYDLKSLLNNLRWDLQRVLPTPLLLGSLTLPVAWAVPRLLPRYRRVTASACLVVLLTMACTVSLMQARDSLHWLPVMMVAVVALGLLLPATSLKAGKESRKGAAPLLTLLLALPLALSFGTNMSVLAHSKIAAVFAVLAVCVQLQAWAHSRPVGARYLRTVILPMCLLMLGLPSLYYQAKAWTDVAFTYRQMSALSQHTVPVPLGAHGDVLLLDKSRRDSLSHVLDSARAAGLKPGQTLLDFSGDGAGLIYALGARPLGTAWAGGGYAGSEAVADRLIDRLDAKSIRHSWLLSSEDNPRRIQGWQAMLARKLGPDSHELASIVRYPAPYAWGPQSPPVITAQFWRPRTSQE